MQVFRESIKAALAFKDNSTDYLDEVMRELEVGHMGIQYQFNWGGGGGGGGTHVKTCPCIPLTLCPNIQSHNHLRMVYGDMLHAPSHNRD